jgi:hypothetical protein
MRVIRGGLAVVLGLAAATGARSAPKFIKFDAPGAAKVVSNACGSACGTLASGNNARGLVVGYYTDKNVVPHAFIRSLDGHFKSFEVKGAGLGRGLNEGTAAYSVNDRGEIAGQYQDSNFVFHGFVRDADGHTTTFNAPDAGTGANQGTVAETINDSGTIAGYYIDANSVLHGFVRVRGTITEYDPPGSTETQVFQNSINKAGTVVSFYFDANQVRHGYARAADGTITSPIDCAGAGTGTDQGTLTESINDAGEMTGGFVTPAGGFQAFTIPPGGTTCTDFNVKGAGPGAFGVSIGPSDAVVGISLDSNIAQHGFVRDQAGRITRFSAPGAGGGQFQGTVPASRYQPRYGVAGYYVDASGLNHGLIWTK